MVTLCGNLEGCCCLGATLGSYIDLDLRSKVCVVTFKVLVQGFKFNTYLINLRLYAT
jgi:hypothetical protein